MSDTTWNGATRAEFVGRAKGLSKRELTDMMRAEGKRVPVMPPRSTHEELVGACFDVLAGKDSTPAAGAPTSTPPAAGDLRYEIRARGRERRVRCGHAFTNQPEPFSPHAFSRAEWDQLRADPYLEVRDLHARAK